jgi:hypothetical protein
VRRVQPAVVFTKRNPWSRAMSSAAQQALAGRVRHAGLTDAAQRLRPGHGHQASPTDTASVGRPIVPDKIAWLASEMLKTRVAPATAHAMGARERARTRTFAGPATTTLLQTEFAPALTDRLADIQVLHADRRGWTSEAQRHGRVAQALQSHLDRSNHAEPNRTHCPDHEGRFKKDSTERSAAGPTCWASFPPAAP